ncbi:hypothetical protein H0H93_013257 [Arthromyces matolae]|nr:hypothetical protein H0H93_013257 [Arthromyces matolae]
MLEWYAENGEASFISALRTLRDEITFNELAASNLQSRIIKFQGLFHAFKEDETDPTTIAQITKFHDHLDRFTSRLQRLVREEAEVKKLRKTDQAAGDRLEDIYFMANEMRDKDSTPFVQTLKKMRETGFRSTQVAAYRKALDSMMVLAKKYQKELEAGNQPQLQVILSRYLSWLREMEVQFEEEMSSRHEDEEEEEEEVDFTVEVIG